MSGSSLESAALGHHTGAHRDHERDHDHKYDSDHERPPGLTTILESRAMMSDRSPRDRLSRDRLPRGRRPRDRPPSDRPPRDTSAGDRPSRDRPPRKRPPHGRPPRVVSDEAFSPSSSASRLNLPQEFQQHGHNPEPEHGQAPEIASSSR